MTCEELREHYDLYALDIAEEPHRGEIREHLQRGCEVCMAGVRNSLEMAALIGTTAPPTQPSEQLRRRILASIGAEDRPARERRSGLLPAWTVGLAIAAVLLVAGFLALSTRRYAQEAASLRDQLHKDTDQIARLTEAFSILSGPHTIEASFGGVQPQPPQGKVFVNPSQGVLLIASNLPRTAADKIYEMWLIPKGANPVPAGLFQSQDDGNAMHVRPGMVDVTSTAAVAVTVENAAGANQPTTTPLIVASLAPAAR
jgi:anti-sigma-K factor RskA